MPVRYGVVIVPFARFGEEIKFLVMERAMNWKGWEFPKGGIDKGESAQKAAVRELKEETGLDTITIKPTTFGCEYFYRREGVTMKSSQEVFIAEVAEMPVKISEEHSNSLWCSKKQALTLLTWQDQRTILEQIDEKKL